MYPLSSGIIDILCPKTPCVPPTHRNITDPAYTQLTPDNSGMTDNDTTCTTLDYRPKLSDEGLQPTHSVEAFNEYGELRTLRVAGELPLTIKVDDAEIVTLI